MSGHAAGAGAGRSLYERLVRAREALDRARANGADPWQVTDLRQRYDEALDAALDAGVDVDAPPYDGRGGPPAPYGAAPVLRLEELVVPARRGGRS